MPNAPRACTAATHDALRADRQRFRAETDFAYLLGDADELYESRRCRLCRSDLAILVVTRECDGTWKVAA